MVNNRAAVMVQMRNSNSSWEMYTFLKNLEIPVNISGISGQLQTPLKIKGNLMCKFSTGSCALAWGNHQSQAKSYFIHIFLLDNGRKGNLGNFGQVWASLGKFG